MWRVKEGEERRRAAVLQDTMSTAVADFGHFLQSELGGEQVIFLKRHRSGKLFWWEMLALLWARKCARSIIRGGKR